MTKIKYILFDVANTLIHKPLFWIKIQEILANYGFDISKEKLQIHHKIISEQTNFPDRTDKNFYAEFNTSFLNSLGIYANDKMLEQIFKECSYLPWEPFSDTSFLWEVTLPIGILSNFKKELLEILSLIFGNIFADIIISEKENLRKPDVCFFEFAIKKIGLQPEEILYVGDSLRLDYIPARQINLNVLLIDRIGSYCSGHYVISSLEQINKFIS